MIKFLPYHLGIIIPSVLILLNGTSTYYSVVRYDSDTKQRWYWIAYAFVWISYGLAIFCSPGHTDGTVDPKGKYTECSKCKLPKPERAHHCRICKRCVLRMDHHCPWTENCVGHRNLPHFVRFLSMAILLDLYGFFRAAAFLIYCVEHRRHLRYFVPNRSRVWLAILAALGDLFVVFTLFALWVRVMLDTANGKTQIENWEIERAETLARRKLAPPAEFPFDVDIFTNIQSALGDVWDWFLPLSGPSGNGHSFPRLVECEQRWPPAENQETAKHSFYRMDRWTSFDGDGLLDFGVEASVEASQASDDDTPLADVAARNHS